jgi:hypothetical protein
MKILKPGETNTRGFLVEYDSGFVASNLSYKGKTNSDLIKEHLQYLNEFKSGTNIGKDGSLPETIIVYAVLQKWGIENKNGRIYPKEILERENKRYQEYIKMGTSLGELNHPESSIIDADRVSHRITETWWDGKTLMGKLELDTTPGYHKMGIISSVGDKVVNMIRKGWTVGISSRGVGSLKQEGGKNVVQDDFELICWDIVTSPSTPGSWISSEEGDLKQFTESYIKDNGCNGYTCQWNLMEENEPTEIHFNSIPTSNNKILNSLNKFLK